MAKFWQKQQFLFGHGTYLAVSWFFFLSDQLLLETTSGMIVKNAFHIEGDFLKTCYPAGHMSKWKQNYLGKWKKIEVPGI